MKTKTLSILILSVVFALSMLVFCACGPTQNNGGGSLGSTSSALGSASTTKPDSGSVSLNPNSSSIGSAGVSSSTDISSSQIVSGDNLSLSSPESSVSSSTPGSSTPSSIGGGNTSSEITHNLTYHEKVEATCVAQGVKEYWSCSKCQKNFSDANATIEITDLVISPLDHDYVEHQAKQETCTEIGWEAYETCSRCSYSTYQEIPALKHDIQNHQAKQETCTEIGWSAYETCLRCDYSTYQEIPAKRHNYVDNQCLYCFKKLTVGLEYTLSSDRNSYILSRIGSATDTEIVNRWIFNWF